jgi:hypothetical protein
MHIHGAIQSIQGASYASIASQGQAAAAKQAAEVRKRLLKSGPTLGADTTPEESLMISRWLSSGEHNSRHSQAFAGDEYTSASEGRDPDRDSNLG